MRLFEAKTIGHSDYLAFVQSAKTEIQRRINLVKKEKYRLANGGDDFEDFDNWQKIGDWLNKQLPEEYGSVEDMFNEFYNVDTEQAKQAVSDLTKFLGKPDKDFDWGEEIYTWKEGDYKVQVFTKKDQDLDLDPFIIVSHDLSFNPEELEHPKYS